jgi:hypothetical protein
VPRQRTWKSRLIDFGIYITIGLGLIGLIWLGVTRGIDADLGTQLLVVVFGACLLLAYIIQSCWKRHQHGMLLIYCLAAVGVHAAIFLLLYRFFGRANAWLVGPVIVLELGVFSYLAERTVSGEASLRYGEPGRNRTCDPRIKSALLYQLSYGPALLNLTQLKPVPRPCT